MADDAQATVDDLPKLIAEAIAEANPKATTSARERLLLGVLTILLSGGSAGGVLAAGYQLLPPHPQVANVQAQVAALEARLDELEDGQREIAAVARETYEIVDRKHPR